ncbi:MAG: NusG domain II-containing protein [Clostridiales bacterium]|nr:NusG domain II-containing protein [Clostridiales bacterium]
MKRSPELKPNLWDILVVLAVVALAAASALTVWPGRDSGSLTAVVTADGEELDRFAPADLAADPRTYTHNGYTLTVTAEDGGLRVSEADCPTQDCVHTGAISRSGQSIVCLPARIIIQLTGGQADPGGVDVVIG